MSGKRIAQTGANSINSKQRQRELRGSDPWRMRERDPGGQARPPAARRGSAPSARRAARVPVRDAPSASRRQTFSQPVASERTLNLQSKSTKLSSSLSGTSPNSQEAGSWVEPRSSVCYSVNRAEILKSTKLGHRHPQTRRPGSCMLVHLNTL